MYITIVQALKKYHITRPTLAKYIKQGSIPTNKSGKIVMIDADDLDDYIRDVQRVGMYTRDTLFDEHGKPIDEKKETQKQASKENKETELALIGGYQSIIQDKDKKIEIQSKEIKIWSNAFFVVATLLLCLITFIFYII